MIIRTLKGGFLRIGGYLAHVGIMLVCGGSDYLDVVCYSLRHGLSSPEGETMTIFGYDLTFNGWRMDATGRGLLDMRVDTVGMLVLPRRNSISIIAWVRRWRLHLSGAKFSKICISAGRISTTL
jgi:hypothetical protein